MTTPNMLADMILSRMRTKTPYARWLIRAAIRRGAEDAGVIFVQRKEAKP